MIDEKFFMEPAFKELNKRQRLLYVICSMKANAKCSDKFPVSWGYIQNFDMYSNVSVFYADLKVLVDAGFLKKVIDGKYTGKTSIYSLSGNWRDFS